MEIETLGEIIKKHQSLSARIQVEAENLNFLIKEETNKLVFDTE